MVCADFRARSIGEVGGHMSKASYLALVAASGLILGMAISPAKAADLGGGCCADLEERVAELEATTARKGNRVVSLQVYGQVNKALLFFDSDVDSDAFVVDNDNSSSRFGFKGTAKIKPGWTAGYNMEFDLNADSNSNKVTEFDDEGASGIEVRVRKNELYVESEQLGRVTIGQGSSAGDGIASIVLANSYSNVGPSAGKGLTIGAHTLGQVADDLSTSRVDRIRYDTPSIYGFIATVSWGEDDLFDATLRFKKEWNSIRVAAGIQYASQTDDNPGSDNADFEQISGSISLMHVPTGIYAAFAALEREDNLNDLTKQYWYVQGGIEKRFFSTGATTIYGEYGLYTDLNHEDEEVTRVGLGINQSIESAAMDIYAQATFWDIEDDAGGEGDLTTFMVGSIIKF
jgi:predicted porin